MDSSGDDDFEEYNKWAHIPLEQRTDEENDAKDEASFRTKQSRKSTAAKDGQQRKMKKQTSSVRDHAPIIITSTTTTITAATTAEENVERFERETEIQVQLRREVLRLYRAEQRKLKATMRRLQRETYLETIKDIRVETMERVYKSASAPSRPGSVTPSTLSPSFLHE